MAKKTKAEQPERTRPPVKMVPNPAPIDEVYVDGTSGLISRGGVIKLDLFRVVGIDPADKTESRQVSHRLVLPMSALPDLLKVFQSLVRASQQAAQQASDEAGAESEGPVSPTGDLVL